MPAPHSPTGQDPELHRVAHIYNEIAPSWDKRQGLVERILMGQAMRTALVSHLHGDVLEVGTGTGPTLRLLEHNHHINEFTGVDLSTGMLARARAHVVGIPFPVQLIEGNAEALPVPDASFDTVTTSLMLCTVPDPARALREMARACRPGGRIVILEHVRARNPFLAWLQRTLTPMQVRMLGCHLDRPTNQLVRDLGFTVEHEQERCFGIFRLMVLQLPA